MDIGYDYLISCGANYQFAPYVSFLTYELPHRWGDAYKLMSTRPTNILRIKSGNFEYIYDAMTMLEVSGAIEFDPVRESRLVGVLGTSARATGRRDNYRLRGWVGPTEKMYRPTRDKGHFIAHSLGGAVDRLEINVFVQRRDLNRGWSAEGKKYREMEKYCARNPGTFCFSRPIYEDETSIPALLDFGLLTTDGVLWINTFDNRETI